MLYSILVIVVIVNYLYFIYYISVILFHIVSFHTNFGKFRTWYKWNVNTRIHDLNAARVWFWSGIGYVHLTVCVGYSERNEVVCQMFSKIVRYIFLRVFECIHMVRVRIPRDNAASACRYPHQVSQQDEQVVI